MRAAATVPHRRALDGRDRSTAATAGGARYRLRPPAARPTLGVLLAVACLGLLLLPGPSIAGATPTATSAARPGSPAPGPVLAAAPTGSRSAGETNGLPSAPTLSGWLWTNLTAGLSAAPCAYQLLFACYVAWDPALGGVVVLSYGGSGAGSMELFANGSFQTISPTAYPPAVFGGGMVYDAADGQLVLFGGQPPGRLSQSQETWVFSGSTWTELSPANSPPPVALFAMAYDPSLSEVVLVGGYSTTSSAEFNATWFFRAGNWTRGPSLPSSGVYDGGLAVDAATGDLLLAGGKTPNGSATGATWQWNASGWSPVAATSGSALPAGIYDLAPSPAGTGVVAYAYGNPEGGTWLYGNGTWANVTLEVGPSTFEFATALATDPIDHATLLLGGMIYIPPNDFPYPVTWVLHSSLGLTGRTAPLGATVSTGRPLEIVAEATGGVGGYQYSWATPPGGCAVATAAGGLPVPNELLCTEAATGNYSVTARVVDPADPPATAFFGFTVVPAPSIGAPEASRPAADVGQMVAFQVPISGGVLPWTVAWTGLPEGCLASSDPLLECTPTAAGATSIAATVTDASGAVAVGAALPFVVAPDPVVGRPTLATPAAGTDVGRWANLSVALLGAGAGGPYTYAWSGLPDGCPAADAATVSCRPAAPGISSISVTVTDANGFAVTSGAATLVVNGNLTVLPVLVSGAATAGTPSVWIAEISGGTAPYAIGWYLGGQEIGTGGTLNYAFAAAGTATVTVAVSDAAGSSTMSNRSISVAPAPNPTTPGPASRTSPGLSPTEVAGIAAAVVLAMAALGVSLFGAMRRRQRPGGQGGTGAPAEPPKGPT